MHITHLESHEKEVSVTTLKMDQLKQRIESTTNGSTSILGKKKKKKTPTYRITFLRLHEVGQFERGIFRPTALGTLFSDLQAT